MKNKTESITYRRLRDVLVYYKDTGAFRWRQNRKGAKAGEYAGYVHGYGYRYIKIDGVSYRASRLAWLYTHGELPKGEIDHINGIRSDDRISNLRDVDHRTNGQNQVCHRGGKLVGCCSFKDRGKWMAQILVGKKRHYLGLYDTEEEGHRAYMEALEKLVC